VSRQTTFGSRRASGRGPSSVSAVQASETTTVRYPKSLAARTVDSTATSVAMPANTRLSTRARRSMVSSSVRSNPLAAWPLTTGSSGRGATSSMTSTAGVPSIRQTQSNCARHSGEFGCPRRRGHGRCRRVDRSRRNRLGEHLCPHYEERGNPPRRRGPPRPIQGLGGNLHLQHDHLRGARRLARARVIAAADDARRQIERDLHDGAQQRLVTLTIALRRAAANVTSGSDELRAEVNRIADGLITAVEELRELSQGIHPAELSEGGLSPALKALGRRSAIRVALDVPFDDRLPDQVEVAAYYTVAEALTNASKHSGAKRVWVSLDLVEDVFRLSIRDDGIGGADASLGSGLTGLRDRIEALGGSLHMQSPRGRGTSIEVKIPAGQSTDQAGERAEIVAGDPPCAV
jgi:signal transduction histidine kinase